jgi:hypothetical protein
MILVSQSYTASSYQRNEELQRVRFRNETSGLFDRVEYLDAGERTISFSEMYSHCESRYRGQWCVISNSDITFGSTAYLLRSMKKEGRLVALTRWEDHAGPRFVGHYDEDRLFSGSQDSWAFLAGCIPRPGLDIPLGVNGCDQVIAGWACLAKAEVINPALSIKTTHIHSCDDRPADRQSMAGFFGYPQLTTTHTTGDVLCHDWPRKDGEWEFDWQLYRSMK